MNNHEIKKRHLPYVQNLDTRPLSAIDLAVIHCTELPDLAAAREYGERLCYTDSQTGNCGHFYIERNGRTEQWVPAERVAHHVRGHNERSIGIELVNQGRYPNWLDSRHQTMTEPYGTLQLSRLVSLLQQLRNALPSLEWITGHQNLDTARVPASDDSELMVFRKQDPGPMFPWNTILAELELKFLNHRLKQMY